ncbi:cutinase family protein [Microbacterium jejuense]|uniref:cutinase family protein n=1 Tax=Microbacterium jejuense TaxID=1263637 RepID=UPI0031E4E624
MFTAPLPVITGTPRVGSTISVTTGQWSPTPSTWKYQWLRDGVAISSATGKTYTVVAADAGAALTVRVSGTSTGYTSLSKVSASATATSPDIVRYLSGAVTEDTTWDALDGKVIVSESVEVASGVHLVIGPGITVKGVISVTGTGSVSAQGTAADPVVFTSQADDSRGGDTNDDDAPNEVSPSDSRYWPTAPLDVRYANGASIELAHVEVHNAWYLFQGYGKPYAADIRDSEIHAQVSLGYGAPSLRRTTIVASQVGSEGLVVAGGSDVTGVILSGPDSVTLVGSARQRAVNLASSTVPAGSKYLLTSESGVSSFVGLPSIPEGATLTLGDGVVVKGGVKVRGTFEAIGSATAPVRLTASWDDSVGGDVDGEGTSSGPGLYSIALDGAAPHVRLVHVEVLNTQALFDYGRFASESAPVIEIHDSEVHAGASLINGAPLIERTSFEGPLSITGEPVGVVVDGPDRITMSGDEPWERTIGFGSYGRTEGEYTLSMASGVSAFLGTPDVGPAGTLILQPGTLVKGTTEVDGGRLEARGTEAAPVVFTDWSDDSTAGDTNDDGPSEPSETWESGTARIVALNGAHIIATHANVLYGQDGVSTYDPAWRNAYMAWRGQSYAHLELDDVHFTHISHTCVHAFGDYQYANAATSGWFHGTVEDCQTGVATDAGQEYPTFDATGVLWATAQGPAPFGPGPAAAGNVAVMPWVGWVDPPPTPVVEPAPAPLTCTADQVVIALRGSGEPPQGVMTPDVFDRFTYQQAVSGDGQETRGVGNILLRMLTGQVVTYPAIGTDNAYSVTRQGLGALGHLEQVDPDRANSTLLLPVLYAAEPVSSLGSWMTVNDNPWGGVYWPATGQWAHLDSTGFVSYMNSIRQGIGQVVRYVDWATDNCPDGTDIVLAGYSQGAMAIRMALAELESHDSELLGRIDLVLLVADPLKSKAGGFVTRSGTDDWSTNGLIKEVFGLGAARGVATWIFDEAQVDAAYPADIPFLSMCNAKDIMCTLGGDVGVHTGYSVQDLDSMAGLAAVWMEAE